MTDDWVPRGEEMKWEDLKPNGARQTEIKNEMRHYLVKLGLKPEMAERVALDLWRITRKR